MYLDFGTIKNAVGIEEVASYFITFTSNTPDGKKALCPFHADRNPSLEVRTSGKYAGTFKCWACGAHGDVISFVERFNHSTNIEAAHWICEHFAPHLLDERESAKFKRFFNGKRRAAASEKNELKSAVREICRVIRNDSPENETRADEITACIEADAFSTEELYSLIHQYGSPATAERIAAQYHQPETEKKNNRPVKTLLNLETFEGWLEEHGISIRLNLISNAVSIEGMDGSGITPEMLEEYAPTYLFDRLRAEFSGCTQSVVTGLCGLTASRHAFNPVLEFLAASPPWDGVDRLEELYRALHIADTDTLSRVLIRNWFIQCVSLQHNSVKHPFGGAGVLVLNGAQGIGKTSFFKKMFLHDTRDDFLETVFRDGTGLFKEGIIVEKDKDSLIQATTGWCCELGELCSTLKDQNEDFLKNFVTRSEDEIRAPYAKTYVKRPRRASFAGTVNDDEFLGDPTGTRRWWVVRIPCRIDLDAIDAIDKALFWKQIEAYSDADRQSFRLADEDGERLNRSNEEFEKKLPAQKEIEDIIMRAAEAPERYRVSEITISEFKLQYDLLRGYNVNTIGRAVRKIYPNGCRHTKEGNKYFLPIPAGNHILL